MGEFCEGKKSKTSTQHECIIYRGRGQTNEMKAATMWQRRGGGGGNQETIGGTTLVSVCGYVNLRVCAAPLCHLSPLALRSCLNGGGGGGDKYPFQSRSGENECAAAEI